MSSPEAGNEPLSELDALKLELSKAVQVYAAMPKGCGCNRAGREKRDARAAYKRNVIRPLEAKIRALEKLN